MRVIRARAYGMCFGVRDALAAARGVEEPAGVAIHGELVHNPEVNEELARRGFRVEKESARGGIPATPKVLITAHGVSDAERARLVSAGKALIDTTCPLVARVHRAAQALEAQGYFVVVVGHRGHVEVLGITGDLARCAVVGSVEEAEAYPSAKIGIVYQTTTAPRDAEKIRRAIEVANPGRVIRSVETVCRPTRQRQEALLDLLQKIDLLVVVGGRHSNNTRQLLLTARARGVPGHQVERASDLEPAWFSPGLVVGLTAGTSTLDSTIDEVHRRLLVIARGMDSNPPAPPIAAAGGGE